VCKLRSWGWCKHELSVIEQLISAAQSAVDRQDSSNAKAEATISPPLFSDQHYALRFALHVLRD
jgi:hypothetical protein